MLMQTTQLAQYNIYYKIRDIMVQTGGFSTADFSIVLNDPPKSNNVIFPVIVIEQGPIVPHHYQLSSGDIRRVLVYVHIFGNNDAQCSDIADLLYDYLNEQSLIFYNFNSSFPSTIGVYTGITTDGSLYVNSVSIYDIEPNDELVNVYKHHKMLNISIDIIRTI